MQTSIEWKNIWYLSVLGRSRVNIDLCWLVINDKLNTWSNYNEELMTKVRDSSKNDQGERHFEGCSWKIQYDKFTEI